MDEQPRQDLTNERVQPWTRSEVVGPNQVRLHYTGGDPRCYGVRVEKSETPQEIMVATIVGTKPDAPKDCTMVASLSSVLVDMEKPVGSRPIKHLETPTLRR